MTHKAWNDAPVHNEFAQLNLHPGTPANCSDRCCRAYAAGVAAGYSYGAAMAQALAGVTRR